MLDVIDLSIVKNFDRTSARFSTAVLSLKYKEILFLNFVNYLI